ncbi:MAG: hypothetical protein ACTSRS_17340 [Candidatus Helarchaeota archaeon]
MAAEIFLITILLIIFAIILGCICLYLAIQIKRSDPLARPFLLSLFLYFFLLCIANIQQAVHNFLNYDQLVLPDVKVTFYTTFVVFVLTLAAPIYLIFQIEKIFFPNSKIVAKVHLTTISNLLFFTTFLGIVSFQASEDITIITEFNFLDYFYVAGVLLAIQIIFVICAFLYLGIKAAGNYRLYALLIALGWLANYAANTVATLAILTPTVILALFIPKLVGVIITAIGLFKLYALRTV